MCSDAFEETALGLILVGMTSDAAVVIVSFFISPCTKSSGQSHTKQATKLVMTEQFP